MKNRNIYMFVIIVTILLASVAILFLNSKNSKEIFLDKYSLKNLSVQEMVSYLDDITNEESGFYASISGTTLTLVDDEDEYTIRVPNDKFYLSFAPYINNTHPCGIHNLVTCRGELKNESMHVVIKDESGRIIINDDFSTMDNGFIGLWLPKNIKGSITVNYQGLSVTETISTYNNSNTCLTTPMKLS